VNFCRLPVQHRDAAVSENLTNLVLFAALIVVVAKHGNDGNVQGGGELAREHPGFVWKAVIGEVTA
jgi:hypothetical protein